MILHWSLLLYVIPVIAQSETIPQCFSDASTLSAVICRNEDLTGIDGTIYDALSISETKINIVRLINCTVTNLDFLDSRYLQDVTHLTLDHVTGFSDNHLSSLVSHLSQKTETLEIINHSSLKSVNALIPPSSNAWGNLKTFRATNNAINAVDPYLFRAMNKVSEFDLRFNRLVEVDLTRHNAITVVRKLLLGYNLLETITDLQFDTLEDVDLAYNQLKDIAFVPTILKSSILKSLDLSNNQIRAFRLDDRVGNGPLTGSLAINLEHNELTDIGDLGKSLANRVETLNLGQNGNLQIKETTFKDLTNLKSLRLHECGISKITTHLQNLPKLELVDMNMNHLIELSNKTFEGSVEVEEIRLRDNSLTKLDFLTTQAITLSKLTKLDVSLNRLDNLVNFVSATALQELRMDGASDKNELSRLSSCLSFTELPTTLKVVCARNIRDSTINSCPYSLFLDLLKAQKVIFNNDDCCDKQSCPDNSVSQYPEEKQCPVKDVVCNTVTIMPGGTTVKPDEGGVTQLTCEPVKREAFQDLHDPEKIVMAIGYILALIFLVMVLILCVRRYRSYDKWLEDYHSRSNGHPASSLPVQFRKSNDTLDTVDGKITVGSPKLSPRLGAYGTLQRQRAQGKSFDNISMASGITQYSTGKSPFAGRKKFKDANSLDAEEQSLRYTSPTRRLQPESGEESPTAMSVYSYASHQPVSQRPSESATPPMERRRHRSGGAVQRLKSNDLLQELMKVDEDIISPDVRIVLQRKATDRRKQFGSSPLARNSRAYGTAPYRSKVKHGMVSKKKSQSPMLLVNRIHRNPGAPTPPMNKRALPDTPFDSTGSINSSVQSASIASSDNLIKINGALSPEDEPEYHETDHLHAELG